jgi:RecA/RadA recombinase
VAGLFADDVCLVCGDSFTISCYEIPVRLLLGRDRELAALERALQGAALGRGDMTRLTGEPGIGKSQLADALADRAATRGTAAIRVKAWEQSSTIPYGVVYDCVRALARPESAQVGGPAWIDRTNPLTPAELRELLEGALLARSDTTLVVIDDLHAADLDSLELLLQIGPALRNSRVLMVATQRSVDIARADETLSLLDAFARTTPSIELAGLEVDAVAALVQELSGRHVDRRTAEAVQRATLGNPLFIEGVVRGAMRDGTLETGTIRVPADLRRAIDARIARLGEPAARMLRSAALLGRPCSLALLAELSGVPCAEAEALLEIAVEAALVAPHGPTHYAFRHSLVGDALAASTPTQERTALHAQIALVLERVEGARASPFELAHHRKRAVSVLGLEQALRAIEYAAEQASRLCAHEEAVHHRRELLALIEGYAPSDAAPRQAALLRLGQAWLAAGKRAHARDRFMDAAGLARERRDVEGFAHAALGVAETGEFGAIDREKLALLEEAGSLLVDSARAELRFRVLSRLGRELWADPGASDRRRALTQELLALAHGLGDATLLCQALDARFQALWGPSGRSERVEILRELRAHVGSSSDPEAAYALHRHALLVAAEHGDLGGFSQELEAFAARVAALRRPSLDETIVQRRILLALARGDLVALDALVPRYRELSAAVQNPQAEMGLRFVLSLRNADTGRKAELAALIPGMQQDAERLANLPFVRARLALMCALVEQTNDARQHLHALVRHALPALHEDLSTLACFAFLAESAWLLNEAVCAAAIYPRLLPHRDHVVAVGSTLCFGSVERYLGLLEWTLGRTPAALDALSRAHAKHQDMGSPPWAARSARELAWLLRARGEPEDLARARQLDLELEGYARSGIVPLGAPGAAATRPAPAAASTSSLKREGELWALEFAARTVRLRDAKGLRLLAALLSEPGREHHVLELVGAAQIVSSASSPELVLDAKARAAYRARIAELRERAQEAAARGDERVLFAARAEREAIEDELKRVSGLGGRARGSGAAERARVAVAKALERTLATLASHHPEAGAHLVRSVRTGLFCCYDPDPSSPRVWEVRA